MRSIELILALVLAQLSLVLAIPTRDIFFNYQSNAACILVNDTSYTNFKFNFANTALDKQIPLIIFNYADLQYFKNLPNLNAFLNHTYLDEKPFLKLGSEKKNGDGKDDEMAFDLKVFRSFEFPEHVEKRLIKEDGEFTYHVPEPGVFCVYLPLYSYDGNLIHPTNYHANMEIQEFQPISVYNDISAHITIAILFGLALLPFKYIYKLKTLRDFDKITPVVREAAQIILVYAVLNGVHVVLELTYLFIPNNFIHSFTEEYFSYFKVLLLEIWQKYVTTMIYLGLGFGNLPETQQGPRNLIQAIFVFNFITAILFRSLTKRTESAVDILINEEPFQIIHKSILVSRFYSNVVTKQYSEIMKTIIIYSTRAQFITGLLLLVATFYSGLKLILHFKSDKTLLRPILSSFLLQLVAWSTFGRHIIYQLYIRLVFAGVFDVGELLSSISTLMEYYEVRMAGSSLVELLLLAFIWYTKKAFDASTLEVEDEKTSEESIDKKAEKKAEKKSSKKTKTQSKKED
ncbi:uncharacterized protein LODBEIA_P18870 [Lodderomyces beijingensis]|uniref:Intimal thickness related receptor IRP domain-containing protein n=1 Tax=Lodderomyces beijingensis TaxID=1775926 RepID=A0ABP0ZHM5_9ASCO